MPEAVTFNQARQNWAVLLDRVVDDHNPLIITRHKAKPVVVMALEDYLSMIVDSSRKLGLPGLDEFSQEEKTK